MGLGDMWHKTLVYFGMADEDDEYYDEQTLTPQDVRERAAGSCCHRAEGGPRSAGTYARG